MSNTSHYAFVKSGIPSKIGKAVDTALDAVDTALNGVVVGADDDSTLMPKAGGTFTGPVTFPASGIQTTGMVDGRVLFPLSNTVSSDSDLTFDIINDRLTTGKIRATQSAPPASAAATGVTGDIQWDSGFIYVCVSTNTWVRAALATW